MTWLVLGASSAIAREFARLAIDLGPVILAGRDREDLEATAADLRARGGHEASVLDYDARDPDPGPVLAEAKARSEHLDIFIAFGLMPSQSEIDAAPQALADTIQVNYTATVALLQAAIPIFEAQKSGHVVVLGSVAGDRGRPKNYVYGSAKAGVHAFLQGYRARLFKLGVAVTTVKPGVVDTAMTWGLPKTPMGASPAVVARDALKGALRRREVVYTPWPWRIIMAVVRAIPEPIFKRLDI